MKKGLMFSIDAVLGIILVFSAVGALALLYANMHGTEKIFQGVEQEAGDVATIGFYLDKPVQGAVSGDAKFAYCAHYYKYNPDNAIGVQALPEEKIFCGEK